MRSQAPRNSSRAPSVQPAPKFDQGTPPSGARASSLHLDPSLLARAARDGVADEHLVMTVGECRIPRGGVSCRDRRIDSRVKGLEPVRKPLCLPTRKRSRRAALLVEDRRGTKQELVWLSPMADPQLLRPPR